MRVSTKVTERGEDDAMLNIPAQPAQPIGADSDRWSRRGSDVARLAQADQFELRRNDP